MIHYSGLVTVESCPRSWEYLLCWLQITENMTQTAKKKFVSPIHVTVSQKYEELRLYPAIQSEPLPLSES